MPARIVWCISFARCVASVWSSSTRRASALPSLSSSALLFGCTAIAIAGFGNSIAGRTSGLSLSVSVSPVAASASFATAPMSPAGISAAGS